MPIQKLDTHYVEIFPSNMNKYPGKKREWYVRFKSINGQTLVTSEGYATKWNAKRAAKKMFPYATIEILD